MVRVIVFCSVLFYITCNLIVIIFTNYLRYYYYYVIDCYWDSFDTCTLEVRALLTKLHTVVENEIILTKRLLAIDGLVKMLLISSEVLPDASMTQSNENKISVKN